MYTYRLNILRGFAETSTELMLFQKASTNKSLTLDLIVFQYSLLQCEIFDLRLNDSVSVSFIHIQDTN